MRAGQPQGIAPTELGHHYLKVTAFGNQGRFFLLIPKLPLGNADLEAPASSYAKQELRLRGYQAGAWEPVQYNIAAGVKQL
jgi:hypothetical protein